MPNFRSVNPQQQSTVQHVRKLLTNHSLGMPPSISRTTVTADNQFIVEMFGSIDDIIQMHVTVLMNQFFTVLGIDKRHFSYQYLGVIEIRVIIQPAGRCVSRVAD